MGTYLGQIKVNNGDMAPIGSTLYGTCDSAAATITKVATVTGFDKLITGVTVHIKFTYAHTGNSIPSLNINSTGAKEIRRHSSEVITGSDYEYWRPGSIVTLTYDGDYWIINNYKFSFYDIFEKIYPVGSIYINTSGSNPGDLIGGTWELLPESFVLKTTTTANTGGSTYAATNTGSKTGFSTNNSSTFNTGGSSSANTGSTTLTAAQSGVPAHSHGASSDTKGAHKHTYNRTYNGTAYKLTSGTGTTVYHSNADSETSENGGHSHTITVNNNTAANASSGHTHTMAHTHVVGAHSHSIPDHNHTPGMPQNIAVFVWKRTA